MKNAQLGRSRATVTIIAAAALAVLAGCQSLGSNSSASTSSSGTQTTSSSGVSGNAIGVTKDTITIAQLADVSGPIPGLFQPAVDGLDAWAAWVNSQGGIDGRQIKIIHKDTALSCTSTANAMKDLPSQVFALVGTFSIDDGCGESTLQSSGMPDVQATIEQPMLEALPNVYSPIPSPPGTSTTGYLWLKDKFGADAVAHTGALEGSADQQLWMAASKTIGSLGYKILYQRFITPTETNFVSDILRMKSEGVQIVDFTFDSVAELATFLQQAAQQNFHPKAVLSPTGYDASLFKLVGNAADTANVIMPITSPLYLGEDAGNVPAVNTINQWMHKVAPNDQVNLFAVYAWDAGELFRAAMEKAGANPSRQGLLEALKATTSFNAGGLMPSTNPGGKVPNVCDVIVGTKDGTFVRLDPTPSGFDCQGKFIAYSS